MPVLVRAIVGLLPLFCCGVAIGQSSRDELPVWPVRDTRPMMRGPASAPPPHASHSRPAQTTAPAPVPAPAQATAPAQVSPEVIDGAVRQASFYSTQERPPLPSADVNLPELKPYVSGALPPAVAASGQPQPIEPATFEPSPSDTIPAIVVPRQQPSTTPTSTSVASAETSQPYQPPKRETGVRRTLAPRTATPLPAGERPRLMDLSWDQMSSETLTTVGASLAFVLGLVMLMAWVWRRAAPRSSRPLPGEVVSIVGRVPLAGRQVAQLIKLGNKLVLVCVTAEGAKPLAEVTDPEEVARLLGLCEQDNPHSATTAFREVFADLTREAPAEGFLGEEAPLVDRKRLADAYANTPGGRAYA